MKLGQGYFSLIGHFEKGPNGGPALIAYPCPAGVPTIGLGSIRRLDGSAVELGDTVTMDEVFLLAERDAKEAADAVRKIQRPLTQHQFEAYTAFAHNLGEGNFRKIAPMIEEGRWEDVAEKMGEYVRAWGRYDGRWYFMALLGLKIRRTAEALHSLGLPWQEVCDPDNIGMPKRREWQPDGIAKDGSKGRYFDVLLPGATEFTAIEAMASQQPAPELILTTKAEPAQSVAQGKAGQPVSDAQPQTPAAPASTKPVAPSVSGSGASGPAPPPKPPQGTSVAPVPSTKPPEQLPAPLPPPRDPLPANLTDPKDMVLSRRFWGLMVTAVGTTHLIPADWSKWMANETTRELVSWVLVVAVGSLIYWWGKRKAKRPLK